MNGRLVAGVALLLASGACTLVRSLDRYDSQSGTATDGGTPSHVTCALSKLADYGAGTPDYLHAITVTRDAVYLAAGPAAPRDAGLPSGADSALVRVDKVTSNAKVVASGLASVSSCAELGDAVVCGVGDDLVSFASDGARSTIGQAPSRVDGVCLGDAGIITSLSDAADGGTATLALFAAGGTPGAPLTTRDMPITLDEPVRLACDGTYAYFAAVNGVGNPFLRRAADLQSLQLQCWLLTTGLSAPIAQTAVTGGHLFFLGTNKRAGYTSGGAHDCDQTPVYLDGAWLALAADPRFVFLRGAAQARLSWADRPAAAPACTVDLGDASVSDSTPFGVVMQTAAFDHDDVYFVAGAHLMRLHVTTTSQ